jgi:hypothetical protein
VESVRRACRYPNVLRLKKALLGGWSTVARISTASLASIVGLAQRRVFPLSYLRNPRIPRFSRNRACVEANAGSVLRFRSGGLTWVPRESSGWGLCYDAECVTMCREKEIEP